MKKPPVGGFTTLLIIDFIRFIPMVPGTRLELVQPMAEGF